MNFERKFKRNKFKKAQGNNHIKKTWKYYQKNKTVNN